MLNLLRNYENKLRPYLCPQIAPTHPPRNVTHTGTYNTREDGISPKGFESSEWEEVIVHWEKFKKAYQKKMPLESGMK